jgi:hypothetical protein
MLVKTNNDVLVLDDEIEMFLMTWNNNFKWGIKQWTKNQ